MPQNELQLCNYVDHSLKCATNSLQRVSREAFHRACTRKVSSFFQQHVSLYSFASLSRGSPDVGALMCRKQAEYEKKKTRT